jgi:tetratricopeptide (TPR) repeat protein
MRSVATNALAVSMLALTLALPARAGEESSVNERVRNVAHDGQSAYEAGRYGEAIKFFQVAYGLLPRSALIFNLAQCHRQLGHPNEASVLLRAFLRTGPTGANALLAARLLVEMENQLQKKAKRGEPMNKSELSEELTLEALLGQKPARAAPPVEEVATIAAPPAVIAQPPVPAAAVAVSPAPPPVRQRTAVPALVASGIAVALLGGGVFEAASSHSSVDQLNQLHATQGAPAGDSQLRSQAKSQASVSKILYASGAVALVTGVVLFFVF